MSKVLGIFLIGLGILFLSQHQLILGAISALIGFCLLPSHPGEYGQ